MNSTIYTHKVQNKIQSKSVFLFLLQAVFVIHGYSAMKKQDTNSAVSTQSKIPGDELIDFSSALDSEEEEDLEDANETQSYEINEAEGDYSFENDYDAPRYIPMSTASGNYQVKISLDAKTLNVISPSGANIFSSRISPGSSSHPTPTGDFRILFRTYKVWSQKYKVYMYYNNFFTRRSNGNYREAIHRGSMASRSHGCVRLPDGAAQEFYNLTGRVGEDNFSIRIR